MSSSAFAAEHRELARDARVLAVCSSPVHGFCKPPADAIELLEGRGVRGDAHCGTEVKHRSRVAKDASQPNLRQVHLIHVELFEALASKGYTLTPGQLGENITTRGIDLLALPEGSELWIGQQARLRITGLRNPCAQIEQFASGLLREVLGRDEHGELVRKTGVMSVVLRGGVVRPGDTITLQLPAPPFRRLAPV